MNWFVLAFVGLVGTGLVCLGYWICRWIDHVFLMKEEHGRTVGYSYLADHVSNTAKKLSMETIREINDNIFKQFGEEP